MKVVTHILMDCTRKQIMSRIFLHITGGIPELSETKIFFIIYDMLLSASSLNSLTSLEVSVCLRKVGVDCPIICR